MKIIFIHGRAQEDFSEVDLMQKWRSAFDDAFHGAGVPLPEHLDFHMPYYAQDLIQLLDHYKGDIKSGKYKMRGPDQTDPVEGLEEELIEELFKATGLSKKEAIKEYEQENEQTDTINSQQTRGIENNRQILALARKLGKHFDWLGNYSIRKKTSDVAAYLMVPKIQEEIGGKMRSLLDNTPTIVIAHSLGTVIAYQVLRELFNHYYDIRALITLGSPLGVKAVQRQLQYLSYWPPCLNGPWINIYDEKDIVALNPITENDFRNVGQLVNIAMENHSKNRHDIIPYLSFPAIAKIITEVLATQAPEKT